MTGLVCHLIWLHNSPECPQPSFQPFRAKTVLFWHLAKSEPYRSQTKAAARACSIPPGGRPLLQSGSQAPLCQPTGAPQECQDPCEPYVNATSQPGGDWNTPGYWLQNGGCGGGVWGRGGEGEHRLCQQVIIWSRGCSWAQPDSFWTHGFQGNPWGPCSPITTNSYLLYMAFGDYLLPPSRNL